MIGYIYITENLINGKKYIGSHHSEIFDESYKGSGTLIKKAINKYGDKNFKVTLLEECFSEDEIVLKEELWISKYNAVEDSNFYNLSQSGYLRGVKGYKHSEETKKKIARKGPANSQYGKDRSGEKNNFYGKKHTEETRRKMSENHADFSGQNNPNYGKRGILSPHFGKKHSEETKKKISEGNKNKTLSQETKDKISLAKSGKKQSAETKLKRSLRCKELGIKPPSQAGKISIADGTISKFIKEDELEFYIEKGFRRGRIKKKKEFWKNS